MEITKIFQGMQTMIAKYNFSEEQRNALVAYAERFTSDKKLILLAEEYYKMIFESDKGLPDINKLKEDDGIEQGKLFAMIYLARCEVLGEVLKAKGIPEKYAQDAIRHYKDLFQRNYNYYGCYGFSGMYRKGMVQYIKPSTFRIGRLLYEMTSFAGFYTVYQNRKTGKTLPLLDGGLRYLPDGKQAPQNYVGECFVTEWLEDEERISGYTVGDDGRLKPGRLTIRKADYGTVLKKGDPILSVHIPGNEKLTDESVQSSFQKAKIFFDTYYKKEHFRAFVCSSWLLDTGLERFLKPESNILKFQKNFKIILSFVNTFALYWNIFGMEKFIPYSQLIPVNEFQRNVLEFLNKGGNLYSGNGYIICQK